MTENHTTSSPMDKWAGGLIVLYGAAHTIGAFAVLGATQYAGSWVTGRLWGENLADLAQWSPALSAYWVSVNSFGPPLILLGATVIWLAYRGITPPRFIAWALLGWTVVDAALSGFGGQALIVIVAAGPLLISAHRAKNRERVAA
jgi:hypothetical protein